MWRNKAELLFAAPGVLSVFVFMFIYLKKGTMHIN